jgi:hypothetical protein
MELNREVKGKVVLLAAALAGSIFASAAGAVGPVLKSGDISQVGQWYGRAGGLVGSDRVANLRGNTTSAEVAITYDKDVAARTNMPSDRTEGAPIAITYDKDVAKRTNMGRTQEPETPIQSAATKK